MLIRACCAQTCAQSVHTSVHTLASIVFCPRYALTCIFVHAVQASKVAPEHTLPQGQRRCPAEGHPPQAPAWQTSSHRCRPQPSTLPQTRLHWYSATAHGTEAVSWPHWHVRVRDRLHGGQSPAKGGYAMFPSQAGAVKRSVHGSVPWVKQRHCKPLGSKFRWERV